MADVTRYWLGPPSKFHEDMQDLEGLPTEDLGGRFFALPSEVKLSKAFDSTMPILMQVQQQCQQQATLKGRMEAIGVVIQGLQVVWIFAADEVGKLKTEIFKLKHDISRLEAKLAKLTPPH